MTGVFKRLVMAVYHGVGEPALALTRRRRRLAAFGLGPDDAPTIPVDLRPGLGPAGFAKPIVARYVAPHGLSALRRRVRVTPMAIDLLRYPDFAAFEAAVKARSSRSLPKVRKASRLGYAVHRFPLRRHVYDVHAVKTSAKMRAAGPVLDYWLLKPEQVGRPATRPIPLKQPPSSTHWTLWWGVFRAEPGHRQGRVVVNERLVAYLKLTRVGEFAHYTDLMAHADHLEDGVMILMHMEIMRWLLESGDPLTDGLGVVVYGAAEHGGEGLLTWKKRAGFAPAHLTRVSGDMLPSSDVAR
ncbi:hypothetical protein ACFQ4O_10110 [Methylopila musalis]|uniref:BioF2-like acetyltransferase domain-containing protein n=1 Tax=Methylopila musalis TaxID=1134781 RepID=A0ABW3Z7R8_9HYPH